MSDIEESAESTPSRPAILSLLDQLGMTVLSDQLGEILRQVRTFAEAHPEIVAKLMEPHDAPEVDDAAPESADFGISLEQEFLIRGDKGESRAILYYEETPNPDGDPVIWIESFAVGKDMRRKGVGKALMRLFLEKYGRQYTIFLRVRPFNDAPMSREKLIQFYANWGFVELLIPTIMVRYPHAPLYKREPV